MNQLNTRRGCKGCLLLALLIGGLVLLVPVFTFMVWKNRSADRLATQIRRLREEGLPTSAAELDQYYTLQPGATDCTHLWLQAASMVETRESYDAYKSVPIVWSNKAIPPPGQPWEDMDTAERLLKQFSPQLEQLHQAAAQGGHARYPLDYSRGPVEMPMPHLQALRTAVHLLQLEAHVKAHRGDSEGAVVAMTAAVAAADSLTREPLVLSQLVRAGLRADAVETMTELTPYLSLDTSQWRRLSAALLDEENISTVLSRTIAGEQALGLTTIKQLRVDATHGVSVLPQDEDQAYLLESMQRMSNACQLPAMQAIQAARRVERDVGETIDASPINRLRFVGANVSLIPVHVLIVSFDSQARSTLGQTMLAIHQYRQDRQSCPSSLEELVPDYLPAVPLDTYAGKPLRYQLEPDGYLLYSVGHNGSDDGGNNDDRLDVVINGRVGTETR